MVLRSIHGFWDAEKKRGENLLVPQQDNLKQLALDCKQALKEIEEILDKYADLDTSNSWMTRTKIQLKYVARDMIHDSGDARAKLQRYTGELALFHTMLT
jgi:hypothetical protein